MDEARILAAAAAAERLGGPPAAVLPARTTAGEERFACAFPRDDGAFAWVVLDDAGAAVTREAEVRSVAETLAMCETAEEAAALLAADEADGLLARALALAGDEAKPALALRAMREALAPLTAARPPIRVAEPGYLDRVAADAALVGDRFDYLKDAAYGVSAALAGTPGESGEALAEAMWAAVRLLARDGAPDRFREAVEGGMGAAQAFADDVLANYLIELEER